MRFYKVEAKCGHVGKNWYFPAAFYITAENGREAAKVARVMPRVKHDHKDAILSVSEIDVDSYVRGKETIMDNPYWLCKNIQEQRIQCRNLEENLVAEVEKTHYLRHRNTTRRTYNDDDFYYLFKNCKCIESYA